MKIVNHDSPTSIDVKRFYPPFKVTDECPTCGQVLEGCGPHSQYLSYPSVNVVEEVHFCCEHLAPDGDFMEGFEDCDYDEWSVEIIITIKAELVK